MVAALRGEQEVQRVALALLKRAGVYRHAAADSPVGALNDILRTGIGRHRGICRALALTRTLHREGSLADDVSGGHRGLERKRHLADLGVSGVVLVGDLLDSGVIQRQDVPTVDLADRASGPVARAGGREVCALRRAVARQVGIDPILEVPVDLDVVDVARAVHLRRIERRVAAQVQPREAVILALERFELFVAAQVERLDLVVEAVQQLELGAAVHIQLPELHFLTVKRLQTAQRVKIELGDRIFADAKIFEGDVAAQVERGELVFKAGQLLEQIVAAHIERGELVTMDLEFNQLPVVFHIERGQTGLGEIQFLQLGVFADVNGFEVIIGLKIKIRQLRQVPDVEGRQIVAGRADYLELFVGAQVERGELTVVAVQLGELRTLAQVERVELVYAAVQILERGSRRAKPQIGELVSGAVEPFHSHVQLQIERCQLLVFAIEIPHIFQVSDALETRDGVAVAEHLLDVILADVECFDLPDDRISQDRAAGDLAHVFPEYRVGEVLFVDRRGACRACRERQQAEHHDQTQEDAENAFFHLFPPPWFGICGGGFSYQNEPLRPWPPPSEKLLESLELLESLWRSILRRDVVVWVKTSSRRVSCSPSAVT